MMETSGRDMRAVILQNTFFSILPMQQYRHYLQVQSKIENEVDGEKENSSEKFGSNRHFSSGMGV
jgi:hypothetical protein